MEGVPFVGNDACAHNLLLKGRPLIMRFRQLSVSDRTDDTGSLLSRRRSECFFARLNFLNRHRSQYKQAEENKYKTGLPLLRP